MRRARFEQLLAGTAIGLALALTPYTGSTFAANDADYDKLRVRVMQAIGTITVETVKEKAETE